MPRPSPTTKPRQLWRGRDPHGRVHHANRRQVNHRPVYESWCGLVNAWLHTVQLEPVSVAKTPLSCFDCLMLFHDDPNR